MFYVIFHPFSPPNPDEGLTWIFKNVCVTFYLNESKNYGFGNNIGCFYYFCMSPLPIHTPRWDRGGLPHNISHQILSHMFTNVLKHSFYHFNILFCTSHPQWLLELKFDLYHFSPSSLMVLAPLFLLTPTIVSRL